LFSMNHMFLRKSGSKDCLFITEVCSFRSNKKIVFMQIFHNFLFFDNFAISTICVNFKMI
jgi:hypothetical protein